MTATALGTALGNDVYACNGEISICHGRSWRAAFPCPVEDCDEMFLSQPDMNRMKCPICDEEVEGYLALQEHSKAKHAPPPLTCNECGKSHLSTAAIQYHYADLHSTGVLQCPAPGCDEEVKSDHGALCTSYVRHCRELHALREFIRRPRSAIDEWTASHAHHKTCIDSLVIPVGVLKDKAR